MNDTYINNLKEAVQETLERFVETAFYCEADTDASYPYTVYELKRLTRQGYEYADRNYFAHDRKLHSTIMNCNFFSALPRLAKRVYGL